MVTFSISWVSMQMAWFQCLLVRSVPPSTYREIGVRATIKLNKSWCLPRSLYRVAAMSLNNMLRIQWLKQTPRHHLLEFLLIFNFSKYSCDWLFLLDYSFVSTAWWKTIFKNSTTKVESHIGNDTCSNNRIILKKNQSLLKTKNRKTHLQDKIWKIR